MQLTGLWCIFSRNKMRLVDDHFKLRLYWCLFFSTWSPEFTSLFLEIRFLLSIFLWSIYYSHLFLLMWKKSQFFLDLEIITEITIFHCRQILYQLSHKGNAPKHLKYTVAWVLSRFSHVWFFATLWTIALQALSTGTVQTRLLEWVAKPSFRPRDPAWVSYVSCIGKEILYH